MLKRGNLRKISKRKINTIKRLNDVPKTAEFNYLQKGRWIPLQNVTEYELERIEFKSILKVNTMKLIQELGKPVYTNKRKIREN